MPRKIVPFPFTQDYLRRILHYDKVTGIFTWKYDPDKPKFWNTKWVGREAGCNQDGYVCIRIYQRHYKAHRLAWFYVHDEQPEEVDHKDLIGNHNWLDNLRAATSSQNKCNRFAQSNNTSGYKGVHKHQGKWVAQIQHKGQYSYLGIYNSPEEAHEVYVAAAKRLHKVYARWNNRPIKRKFRPMPPPKILRRHRA